MRWIEIIPGVHKPYQQGFPSVALYSQHFQHPPGTWVLIAPGIHEVVGMNLLPEDAIARATEILEREGVKE